MHEILVARQDGTYNITALVASITWTSDLAALGQQLDFELAAHDDPYLPRNVVDLGNLAILRNGKEIMRGIVVSDGASGRAPRTYTAFDYAFYLNKSKRTWQFNRARADSAIRRIVTEYGIPIGQITAIPLVLTKIYAGQTGADVISAILEEALKQTGVKYHTEIRDGAFYCEPFSALKLQQSYKVAAGNYLVNPTRNRSISDMRNAVVVYTGSESKYRKLAEIKDAGLIAKFGLLQEMVSITEEEAPKARNVAQNLLRDLAKISESGSLELLGDDTVRAGRLIDVEEPITGLKGTYLVKNCRHTVANGIHKMQLALEVL